MSLLAHLLFRKGHQTLPLASIVSCCQNEHSPWYYKVMSGAPERLGVEHWQHVEEKRDSSDEAV